MQINLGEFNTNISNLFNIKKNIDDFNNEFKDGEEQLARLGLIYFS